MSAQRVARDTAQGGFDMAVAKLTERTTRMFAEYERFEWFLEQLEGQSERYTVDALRVLLCTRPTRPAQRHRILTLLATHPDMRAEEVLREFAPGHGEDASVGMFRRFALTHRDAPW